MFCGETIIPKGLRGSQLSFKFTIRNSQKGGNVMKYGGMAALSERCSKMNASKARAALEHMPDNAGNRYFICYPLSGAGKAQHSSDEPQRYE